MLTYKKTDIKYDIEKEWIILESPPSGGEVLIDLGSTESMNTPDESINRAHTPTPPSTPLSAAQTPLRPVTRAHQNASPSGRAQQRAEASARISQLYSNTGRFRMPPILEDNDSISAMLERGTINRDFMLSMQELGFGDEPLSYKERLLWPDSSKWAEAEDQEWDAINSMGTFKWITYEEMYKINPHANVISTKWCYKRKPDRYKARVVARGFLQSPWDVGETHSNVAKLSTVRALLSKAAVNDYNIRQLDIGNAYLCADIVNEHVFCSPPEGRERPGYVMYLQKALYGLKNSAKAWFDTFSEFLTEIGYTRSDFDDCLWEYKNGDKKVYIVVFVDDLLVIGDDSYINDFMTCVNKKFKIRDLGEAKSFLGMEITRNRENRTLKISQTKYIEKMATRFNLNKAKPVYTPLDTRVSLQKSKDKTDLHPDNELYRSIIGSCMYAVILCRPDALYAVCKLSRYLNEPTKTHMTQAKRVLT